ncbi:MAG: hypothetical protein P1U85_12565 [Verrucomicrobiales bacterium]|jgi:hypothetical protein|nr:hypothetical protein [Verrucomicrobiales bacterium]
MKDDLEIESMLRDLRPQQLPADLRTRMKEPPVRTDRWKRVVAPAVLAAAAVWVVSLILPSMPPRAGGTLEPVTILQQQSSLIDSRVIAVIQGDGQAWEVMDQEWLDEELAICSSSSVQVRFTATRRELVYQPVPYY